MAINTRMMLDGGDVAMPNKNAATLAAVEEARIAEEKAAAWVAAAQKAIEVSKTAAAAQAAINSANAAAAAQAAAQAQAAAAQAAATAKTAAAKAAADKAIAEAKAASDKAAVDAKKSADAATAAAAAKTAAAQKAALDAATKAAADAAAAKVTATTTPTKTQPATGGTLIDGKTGRPFSGVHTDGKTYQDGKVVEAKPDPERLASLSGKKLTEADGDAYYTAKVGSTGKTSAQLDAAAGAANVAASTGAVTDKTTGTLYPKGTSQTEIDRINATNAAQAATEKAAQEKAVAEAKAKGIADAAKTSTVPTVAKPDPTKTAYADLTPAQRAAMSQQEKMDYIEAARVASMAGAAATRATTDPMFDFGNRPTAPTPKPGKINYYSWIGGVKDGQWKLYEADDTPENQAKYGGRSVGGATAATANSAVGANTLVTPGASTLKPGDPGYVAPKVPKFGEPGYVLKPGDPGYVAPGGDDTTPKAPVGTPPAYVYDPVSKTWKEPTKPTTAGNWVFDANKGWVDTPVVPGSGGMSAGSEKTLALDTFKNTLALLFGPKEASQPWVTALYTSASKFYNTGSTIDESINLSLQDIRYNKDLKSFTDRFNGIYSLTDRLAKGEAITVPTVAEYFATEAAMGDVLRSAGMGELANQNFLGGIIGLGKSVLEVTNLITDTFDRIDNAPSALKADLQKFFSGADRTSIAKAMLLGDKGAAELTKKVEAISVQSAAKTQGVNINDLTSEDIAAQGYDYNKSLGGFATVKQLERGQSLGRMSNIDFTQQEAIASTFGSNAAADEKIRKIKEEEINRFSGSSGRLSSKDRAQGLI